MGVGGPAPPAGFPPTHCRSRPGRHRRALRGSRPGARGYMETGNALAAKLLLFVADNGAAAVPSHEVAYTAGVFGGEGCVNIARYLQRGSPYPPLPIIFTNTPFPGLPWLQERWGV